MRNVICGGLAAAALGTVLAVAGAFPASAQVARPQSALASGSDNSGVLTMVADRRSGGGRAERSGGGGGGNFAMRSGGGGRNFAVRDGGGHRSANSSRARTDSFRVAGAHRGDHRRNNWRWRHRDGGWGWGSGVAFGYGLGYGLGYAAPYYAYGDYAYSGDDDNAVAYCMSRFQSYDPSSGTYLGYDGLRHPCP